MQDVCESDHGSATSGEEKSFEKEEEEEVVGVAEKKGSGEKIEMEVQKIV